MEEILYIEVPVSDSALIAHWLRKKWNIDESHKKDTTQGLRLKFPNTPGELSVFLWSVQNTTYLKAFRWGNFPPAFARRLGQNLKYSLQQAFPPTYPEPPEIDLSQESIFSALAQQYPKTVHFFQKIPNGESALIRAYWWEQRWRSEARNPKHPKTVVKKTTNEPEKSPNYDLIYVGGALGVISATLMAQMGYRVLLLERLPFGRMNREWNISRQEFQALIDLDLFTTDEFETLIAREYKDGFNKFFDGNNPPHLKGDVLHTPTVLNIALDSEKLLAMCGEKLIAAGGEIWDETEFVEAEVSNTAVTVHCQHLPTEKPKQAVGRLLIDAMGSASPIAWQLNGKRAFDSVCPTVGATVKSGFPEGVWDSEYGDVLNSHGDISRGRQLIWELFPAAEEELTIYLFHYHQVHPDNPGSLLEMYEDFFTILPEYRRCDMEQLQWKKATFGYIPGHFSVGDRDRAVAFDRLLALGDAASLQSPLVFTGFGSLVRNLDRLTTLLETALKHDLLEAKHLNQVRAYQSNVAVTWLFSKGMMVPTGKTLPPQRINAMLNTFFGLLANEPPEVADTFIKDRTGWFLFNRLALKAASMNPALISWIWQQAGAKDFFRWVGSYLSFTLDAIIGFLFRGWFPQWLEKNQSWLEKRFPALWLKGLSFSYSLTNGLGRLRAK
ncbi:MAG: flavin-dependent dehydrogenase [Halothece sp. Uz-M2-17]|nr:flavin-dependent dehydrogenase [Halothece sp. Uz-M2-17]